MNQRTVVCSGIDKELSTQLKVAVQKNGGELYLAADLHEWGDALDQRFPWLAILGIDSLTTAPSSPTDHQGTIGEITKHEVVHPEEQRSGEKHHVEEERPEWQAEWQRVLRRVKLRPHTKYIPLIAVSHDNLDGLAKAEQLGAEQVWLIENLKPQLPVMVKRYLDPPIHYPFGWDEALPALAQEGLRHFNQGDYFEQHELLEEAWRAESRPIRDFYQGILQIGVAFYQIQLGNWKGAIKTFRRALPKLRDLPPVCQGVNLTDFRKRAEEIHADITSLGPDGLEQFDQSRFPQIQYELHNSSVE